MKNNKVVIYNRVATEDQVNTASSLVKQMEACRKYCEKHNLDALVEVSEFGSGSSAHTPGLADYLEHVKETQYDISGIVVYDLTRISRDVPTQTAFVEKLGTLNLSLHVVNGGIIQAMMTAINEESRKQISERIKLGIANKRANNGKMVKSTATGRNNKKITYKKEVIAPKTKAQRTRK